MGGLKDTCSRLGVPATLSCSEAVVCDVERTPVELVYHPRSPSPGGSFEHVQSLN